MAFKHKNSESQLELSIYLNSFQYTMICCYVSECLFINCVACPCTPCTICRALTNYVQQNNWIKSRHFNGQNKTLALLTCYVNNNICVQTMRRIDASQFCVSIQLFACSTLTRPRYGCPLISCRFVIMQSTQKERQTTAHLYNAIFLPTWMKRSNSLFVSITTWRNTINQLALLIVCV